MAKEPTRRAADVVAEEGLNIKDAYEVLYAEGLDPHALTPEQVELLREAVRSGRSVTKKPLIAEDLRDKTLVVLRNTAEHCDIYWLAGQDVDMDDPLVYTMEDLYRALKERLGPEDIRPLPIERHPAPPRHERAGGSQPGTKTSGMAYKSVLTPAAYTYLLAHMDELRPYLHIDEDTGITLDRQTVLSREVQKRVFKQSWEAMEAAGYQVKGVLSPADLLARIVKKMRNQLSTRIEIYLATPEAAFLNRFPGFMDSYLDLRNRKLDDRLWDYGDVRQAVQWLEQDMPAASTSPLEEMPFFVRCLQRKYKEKFRERKGDDEFSRAQVPDTWVAMAHNYLFTREHPWALRELPKKASAEEYSLAIARLFVAPDGNKPLYHPGDASRIFDGLYVMQNIDPDLSVPDLRRTFGSATNYLILNVETIGNTVDVVADRIRARKLQQNVPKAHHQIYKEIQRTLRGGYEITGDNRSAVRTALNSQFHDNEREVLTQLRQPATQAISDTYRLRVLELYLSLTGTV